MAVQTKRQLVFAGVWKVLHVTAEANSRLIIWSCSYHDGRQMEGALHYLLAENKNEIEAAHPCLDVVYSHKIARFLFALANILNLTNETKYLALEIFHRFLLGQLDSLMTYTTSNTAERHLKDRPLKMYARKIKEQIPIRALACVMIASKLTSHKNQFASNLISCVPWLKVQPKDICRSETQILKQLGFRCCKTSSALDYIGLAVSVAGLWHGDSNPFISKIRRISIELLLAESVHETAVELLDFVCLNRERVYERLCHSLTSQPPRRSTQYQAMFARVLADRMLLAGSVVTAAAVVLGGPKAAAVMAASLCVVLPVTHKDLLTFASCVLDCANLPMPLCNLLREKKIKKENQTLPSNHLVKRIRRNISKYSSGT